jgi:hypothetical protein
MLGVGGMGGKTTGAARVTGEPCATDYIGRNASGRPASCVGHLG